MQKIGNNQSEDSVQHDFAVIYLPLNVKWNLIVNLSISKMLPCYSQNLAEFSRSTYYKFTGSS